MIEDKIENNLSLEEFREVLINSTLGERRPVNEPERLQQMLEHGNLIVTARDNGKLAGVSRSLTDFMFCTYLSDLAVDTTYQQTPKAKLILLAALAAIDYYPKIGMAKFDYCYYNDDVNAIK